MNLLARREQSFTELTNKVTRKFPELDRDAVILPALERLRAENLQSDARFTESYVRYRATRGMGPLKIAMELDQKGISGSQARAELYQEAFDWVALCREAMARKFTDEPPGSPDERQKRYRFLQQRGFDHEQIRQVLG